MTELKIYPSKKKAFDFLLISLVLTVADVYIIYNGNNNWKAWMGLIIFSSCTVIFIFRLYSDKPELIIDTTGITGRGTANKSVKWGSISNAYLNKVNNQTFICLVMNKNENPYKDETGFKKDVIDFNKGFFGIGDVNLNVGSLNCDKKKILQLMLALIESVNNIERKKVLDNYLLSD